MAGTVAGGGFGVKVVLTVVSSDISVSDSDSDSCILVSMNDISREKVSLVYLLFLSILDYFLRLLFLGVVFCSSSF
jgi:hypothetical protein